jgi:microcystin-dependent protein
MKKVTGAFAAFLYSSSALWGATLLPNGQQQFIDANGKPYANGRVFFYSNFPTCSVLKNTYQNEAGTVLNTNPVVLSASGTATIFGTGAYCQVLKDANNTTIWTKYTSDTSSASNLGWGGTGSGSANAQTVTVTGFSNVNGQTFYYVPSVTNTGPLTLSVNGGPAVAVVKATPTGSTLLSGSEVYAGSVTGVTYVAATGQFNLVTNNNTLTGYPGEVRTFAYASCPAGWLNADGTSVSASTYPNLFAVLGTTWGVSAGNVVLPNFQNQFLRGDGTSVVGTYEADTYLNHSHAVTDPGHFHSYTPPIAITVLNGTLAVTAAATGASTSTGTSSTGLTVNTSTTGGTETRPKNYRVRFCIKF